MEEHRVSEEDLRNNQDTRYAMYEDIYSSGYDHVDAAKEQEEGCDNEFIEEFRQYSLDRNLEKVPDPNATETPSDTSGSTGEKYEVSPGVYNDGTVRKPSTEEWETYTDEEKEIWREAYSKQLGGQSWDDLDKISEEATQEAFDMLNDPNNPYIQEILDYKASLNNWQSIKAINMTSKIQSTPQASMSKTLEKHREQLKTQSRQNDIKQSDSYIREKNTIIR